MAWMLTKARAVVIGDDDKVVSREFSRLYLLRMRFLFFTMILKYPFINVRCFRYFNIDYIWIEMNEQAHWN